jgi:hypothetical protein
MLSATSPGGSPPGSAASCALSDLDTVNLPSQHGFKKWCGDKKTTWVNRVASIAFAISLARHD